MRIAVMVVVAGLAAPAHADGLVLEVGIAAPAGVDVGAGVRVRHWQVVAEAGGAGAAFVAMMSASVRLGRDVWWRERNTLAVAVSATRLGYIAGSDVVDSGTIDTIGPALEWRHAGSGRTQLVIDAGAALGRCRGDCHATFVMPLVALRLAWPF